ncbi:MAG: TetR/AcrR family transcriptional regulator [Deltaproteobacteria bacterium]|nr:MAG: TetR/AcrR family transcriptional regulator [Deltaproteobacteria bacterium]
MATVTMADHAEDPGLAPASAPVPEQPAGRRRRRRRTQAERSAATREKVITAATECIAELGYAAATMTRIAERAGVSWGAMQHQFGDKDAIIDAVVERSLEGFVASMRGLRRAEPILEDRVRAFTERAWQNFQGPGFKAVLNIVLQRRDKVERIASVLGNEWSEIFGDLGLSTEQLFAAQRVAFVMLAGIATESVLIPGAPDTRMHFDILERALIGMLSGGSASGR